MKADEGAGTQDSYKIRAKMLQYLYLYAYRIYMQDIYAYRIYMPIGYTHTFLVKDGKMEEQDMYLFQGSVQWYTGLEYAVLRIYKGLT